MYYRIKDNIALRSWKLVPFAFYRKGYRYAEKLTSEEFFAAMLCDGNRDFAHSGLLCALVKKGVIEPCEKGNAPSEWSRLRDCPCRYMPAALVSITGRCNMNCRHCFMAADVSPTFDEWKYEDLLDLLDQFVECGVQSVGLTGGEPMLHPRFSDILREIAKRNLTLSEICTNAALVTDKTCDEIKSLGFSPVFRVSFDGAGVHDWMRRVPGAEEQALGKLSLLKKQGFYVRVQCNVNRHTAPALKKTARLLDGMGIDSIRIIQTGSSPRWAALGGEENYSYEEYYDLIFDFLRDYLSEPRNMSVTVWQTVEVFPGQHSFTLTPGDDSSERNYSDNAPVCRSARGQMHITASGDVAPCSPMAGFFRAHGKVLANIHNTPLRNILSESCFLDTVCTPVSKIRGTDADCAACQFWKRCRGGCRALAMAQTGELAYYGKDASKCVWFKGDYEQKALSLMAEIGAKTGVEWKQTQKD